MESLIADAMRLSPKFGARVQDYLAQRPEGSKGYLVLRGDILTLCYHDQAAYNALGCPLCFRETPELSRTGDIVINGLPAIHADQTRIDWSRLPEVVRANLWLCPRCRLPIRSVQPRYETV